MNRRRTIAALAVIGAGSVAVAPSFAQDPSSAPSGARMATERAAPSSGVVPAQPPRLGTKRNATSQEGPELQSQKTVRPLSLSPGAAPNLPKAAPNLPK
jgi:hypothetical protein